MTTQSNRQPLSAADASNLLLEHPGQPFTIGVAAVVAAGAILTAAGTPDVERLREILAPRIRSVPRLCRRVVPAGDAPWRRAVWVDCEVDLRQHIRAADPVSGAAGFAELASRLMSRPLPRDRPLWDMVVVAGVAPGQVGIIVRMHHAVADGVTGVGIMAALFDPLSPTADPPPVAAGPPQPSPPGRLLTFLQVAAATAGSAAVMLRRVPRTALVGPLGPRRRVTFLTTDVEAVRRAAHAAGVTVNDVLLSAVGSATQALLAAQGRQPFELPVSVPVALPAQGDGRHPSAGGNRVGVMVIRLPLTAAPHRRLALIAAATRRGKRRARLVGAFPLTAGRCSTRLMSLMSRHQRAVALFVTNVHGPAARLSIAGADVMTLWPLTVLAGNVRVSVAALSYAGNLGITITSDADNLGGIAVFVEDLRRSMPSRITATPSI